MSRKPRFSLKDSQVVKSYYRVHKRVLDFFGDDVKATDWMLTPNMWFHGLSPLDMIEKGMTKDLEKYIIAQLDDEDTLVSITGFNHEKS